MHIYWFMKDQSNMYSFSWPICRSLALCVEVGIINMIIVSNYSSLVWYHPLYLAREINLAYILLIKYCLIMYGEVSEFKF